MQIDRLDAGQMLAAEALRQMQARVAAAPRIHFGLDRGRRRHQHDRDIGAMRARTTAMSRAW